MNIPQYVAYNLLEKIAKIHHSWGSVRQVFAMSTPKIGGIYEVNAFDHMSTKVDVLYQNINILRITPLTPPILALVGFVAPATLYCEICGVNGHTDRDCQMILKGGSNQENANFMNNNQRNNPYPNTYNMGWRDTLTSLIGTTTPNKP